MFKIARQTISSISAQVDGDGKEDFREQPSDAELSPEALEDRERKEIEDQIVDKWTKVWFGLYQIRERNGPYHVDQLRKLYLGAGWAGHLAKQELSGEHVSHPLLGLLEIAFSANRHHSTDFTSEGIQSLRLFDNLSIPTLRSTLDLLDAYEREIESFQEIYTLLRSLQVDISRAPTEEDEQELQTRYPPIADPVAERILHYNSRLAVLVMDVEAEAMERYKQIQPREDEFGASSKSPPIGWYVKDRVFPRGKRSGMFSSSIG